MLWPSPMEVRCLDGASVLQSKLPQPNSLRNWLDVRERARFCGETLVNGVECLAFRALAPVARHVLAGGEVARVWGTHPGILAHLMHASTDTMSLNLDSHSRAPESGVFLPVHETRWTIVKSSIPL